MGGQMTTRAWVGAGCPLCPGALQVAGGVPAGDTVPEEAELLFHLPFPFPAPPEPCWNSL